MVIAYLGLTLLVITNVEIPRVVWYSGIPIIMIGLVLQFFSNRLLWIRIYQAFVFSICALIHLYVLWIISAQNSILIATISVLIIALSIGFASILIVKNSRKKWKMQGIETPHGVVGILHKKTGTIDPYHSPRLVQAEIDDSNKKFASLGKFSLLIPGITMLIVQVLSQSILMIGIAISAFFMFSFSIAGTIGVITDVMSIIQWQKENGKYIRVNL